MKIQIDNITYVKSQIEILKITAKSYSVSEDNKNKDESRRLRNLSVNLIFNILRCIDNNSSDVKLGKYLTEYDVSSTISFLSRDSGIRDNYHADLQIPVEIFRKYYLDHLSSEFRNSPVFSQARYIISQSFSPSTLARQLRLEYKLREVDDYLGKLKYRVKFKCLGSTATYVVESKSSNIFSRWRYIGTYPTLEKAENVYKTTLNFRE